MRRNVDYLAIPEGYFHWLGGLRWSREGDAIEYALDDPDSPRTFALNGELSLFLEGYMAAEHTACFAFLLQFLDILGAGRRAPVVPSFTASRRAEEVARLFRECGRPFFNAGVLAAHIGRDWPPARVQPDLREVTAHLTKSFPSRILIGVWGMRPTAEVPPLQPADFTFLVLNALSAMDDAELRHWLRTGRAPVAADVVVPIADLAEAVRPRSLALVLARLESRKRLRGAQPLVAQVLGAFTLPPRRLATADLPTGGYADLTTRGQPEHLLPTQFALDDLEFLRRFAERELLYHHREEPNAPTSEELVVVLDQGVRTWGDARLVLAAVALALGRLAEKRGWRLLIVTTGAPETTIDPLLVDEETLGRQFEAADLSTSPAQALATALNTPRPSGLRDVVLLTHKRNLEDPAIVAVAGRAVAGTRLFGVGVDASGEVLFVEMVGGGAVPRARCRVQPRPNAIVPPETLPPPSANTRPGWTGDVEPIGFPFQLGLYQPFEGRLMDFDEAGEWLFLVSVPGFVFAWNIISGRVEVLPRGMVGSPPLTKVAALVGVADGVVTAGWVDGRLILVHHDMVRRRVRAHDLGDVADALSSTWELSRRDEPICSIGAKEIGTLDYHAEFHSVVVRGRWPSYWAVSLHDAELSVVAATDLASSSPARLAIDRSIAHDKELGDLANQDDRSNRRVLFGPRLIYEHRRLDGTFRFLAPGRVPCVIPAPGRSAGPVHIVKAEWRGDVIAASLFHGEGRASQAETSLVLYRTPQGVPIGEVGDLADPDAFKLSHDGRVLAYVIDGRRIAVQAVNEGPTRKTLHAQDGPPERLYVDLGDDFILVRSSKLRYHLIHWESGVLHHVSGPASRVGLENGGRASRSRTRLARDSGEPLPRAIADPARFVAWAHRGIWAALDFTNQISILDNTGGLRCIFIIMREHFGAWMPDGTCRGPARLIGGPATPNASERIGRELKRASEAALTRGPTR